MRGGARRLVLGGSLWVGGAVAVAVEVAMVVLTYPA